MTVGLLRSNAPFRWLWSARTVSYLGDSLSLVALMLHVAQTTGEAVTVALLLLAGDFAPSLLSPFTGTFSDRFDPRRVMVVCELVQGALVVAIALALPVLSLPALLVLVALRATAGQVFQPASRSAVPLLVDDSELPRANSAIGFGTNGAEAFGPLAAAALFALIDVRGVLLIDAATFLVSAAMLSRVPRLRAPGTAHAAHFLTEARAGLRFLRTSPVVRTIVVGFWAVVACTGVDDVALVFLATDSLGGGESAVGLLLAGVGVGLLVGYLILGRVSGRLSMVPLFLAGLAISSAGNLLTGLAWAVVAAFALQTIRGIGIAALDVGANTLLQRLVPGEMLGRVFGNLYGGIGVAAALSYLVGGLLVDVTSPRVVLVVAGAGGLVATAATAVALRRRQAGASRL